MAYVAVRLVSQSGRNAERRRDVKRHLTMAKYLRRQTRQESRATTMDPQETLALLIEAIRRNEIEDMNEHAGTLYDWIKKGGYTPSLESLDHFDSYKLWTTLLAYLIDGTE